ncbi:MAG: hypothetical protein AAGD96_16850, partial [Chloroflexota bacterium]
MRKSISVRWEIILLIVFGLVIFLATGIQDTAQGAPQTQLAKQFESAQSSLDASENGEVKLIVQLGLGQLTSSQNEAERAAEKATAIRTAQVDLLSTLPAGSATAYAQYQ